LSRNIGHRRKLKSLTSCVLNCAISSNEARNTFANELVVVKAYFALAAFGIKTYDVVGVRVRVKSGTRNAIAIGRKHDVYAIFDHFIDVEDDGAIIFPSSTTSNFKAWIFWQERGKVGMRAVGEGPPVVGLAPRKKPSAPDRKERFVGGHVAEGRYSVHIVSRYGHR